MVLIHISIALIVYLFCMLNNKKFWCNEILLFLPACSRCVLVCHRSLRIWTNFSSGMNFMEKVARGRKSHLATSCRVPELYSFPSFRSHLLQDGFGACPRWEIPFRFLSYLKPISPLDLLCIILKLNGFLTSTSVRKSSRISHKFVSSAPPRSAVVCK